MKKVFLSLIMLALAFTINAQIVSLPSAKIDVNAKFVSSDGVEHDLNTDLTVLTDSINQPSNYRATDLISQSWVGDYVVLVVEGQNKVYSGVTLFKIGITNNKVVRIIQGSYTPRTIVAKGHSFPE